MERRVRISKSAFLRRGHQSKYHLGFSTKTRKSIVLGFENLSLSINISTFQQTRTHLPLMAPKFKKKGRGRRSKTLGQTSASNPDPTATSPSVSSPTGDATATSLVPSSAFPSAPPPTTTTQLIPSASPQPTSILPSSAKQITTTQPLPSAPPLPVQETHQEFISCPTEGSTTADLPGPSTAPSESVASTRTPTFLPIPNEVLSLLTPAAAAAMRALQSGKEENPADFLEMIVGMLALQLDDMESVIASVLEWAVIMDVDAEMNVALEGLSNMEGLKRLIELTKTMLAERKKRHGSGGSKGGGGGPDSGSGEGDGGEGGGVTA